MIKPTHNTFKILGLLLQYPSNRLYDVFDPCKQALIEEALLPSEIQNDIMKLMDYLQGDDLLEREENYVSLFDFNRLLSLYLFEHLHGDSRDRGQALVDLLAHYEKNKLELQPGEMPDYLPVFLEHLSFFSYEDAGKLIGTYVNIITLLERRLMEHQSPYSAVFSAICALSPKKADEQHIEKEMRNYHKEKDIKKNMDEKWQEPEVFPKKCPSSCPAASNINSLSTDDS